MKWIIYHAKHIGLRRVVQSYYVKYQHFERSLMFIVQTM